MEENERPPKVVALLSRKGGVGKSTIALNLAVLLSERASVVMLDMDPQGSLSRWADRRKKNRKLTPSERENPLVTQMTQRPENLRRVLAKVEEYDVEYCVIDTPSNVVAAAQAAVRAADCVLIPVRASYFDLSAIRETAEYVESAGKPLFGVLNGLKVGSSAGAEAEEALRELGIPTLDARLSDRLVYSRSVTSGLSVTEAANRELGGETRQEADAAALEVRAMRAELFRRMPALAAAGAPPERASEKAEEAGERPQAPAPPEAGNGGAADMKEVSFSLPRQMWKDMRWACIEKEQSIQEWMKEAVRAQLEAEARG